MFTVQTVFNNLAWLHGPTSLVHLLSTVWRQHGLTIAYTPAISCLQIRCRRRSFSLPEPSRTCSKRRRSTACKIPSPNFPPSFKRLLCSRFPKTGKWQDRKSSSRRRWRSSKLAATRLQSWRQAQRKRRRITLKELSWVWRHRCRRQRNCRLKKTTVMSISPRHWTSLHLR